MNCNPQSLASASACFDFCVSAGNAGPLKSYLWCQIANTAKFGGGGPGFAAPTNPNFSINFNGTFILANAGPIAPANAVSAELWTAPDNINFTLNQTITPANANVSLTPPAVGSFIWAMFRWKDASGNTGPFSSPTLGISGRAADWAHRAVVTNGGSSTVASNAAVNALDLAVVAASLDASCLWILPVPPDSLIQALTPLYKVIGNDPAVASNLVGGDLTANGLAGNATNKSFDTGVNQTAINGQSAGSCSYFCYRNTTNNNTEADMDMNDASNTFGLLSNNSPALTFDSPFSAGSGRVTVNQGLWKGYYLGSRTSVTFAAVYLANSTTAHNQAGTNNTNIGNIPNSNTNFWGLAQNNVGVINFASGKTYGGFGFLKGLTQAQSLAFFNAWQAYRNTVGGAV